MTEISRFEGKYRFLSNFYPLHNSTKTLEHFYQASKTTNMDWQRRILESDTPGQAKRLGRQCPIRSDWDSIKVQTMYILLKMKFDNPELANLLRQTGEAELIEGNHWGDTFWGVCQGQGQNQLGKLLMLVRDELNQF